MSDCSSQMSDEVVQTYTQKLRARLALNMQKVAQYEDTIVTNNRLFDEDDDDSDEVRDAEEDKEFLIQTGALIAHSSQLQLKRIETRDDAISDMMSVKYDDCVSDTTSILKID